MICVLIANGFEEIEALTPVDILRRKGLDVKTVSITEEKLAVGSHGITITCDEIAKNIDEKEIEALIFPGGMPGATNLDASEYTDKFIAAVKEKDGVIAAICAAPLILGRRGLLKGKKAICYPGFEEELVGATLSKSGVAVDGRIVTAKSMEYSLPFANAIASLLVNRESETEACLMSLSGILDEEDEDSNESILSDATFNEALDIAFSTGKISTSLLQRKLFIGYSKAAMLIDAMEDLGIVSEINGQKPREVLITKEEWKELLAKRSLDD